MKITINKPPKPQEACYAFVLAIGVIAGYGLCFIVMYLLALLN